MAGLLAMAVVFAVAVEAGLAKSACLLRSTGCPGRLVGAFRDAQVQPAVLPEKRSVPVALEAGAEISVAGGTPPSAHPSALRKADMLVDEDVTIDAEGLSACGYRKLAAGDGKRVRAACRKAIVGRGRAQIGVSFPESAPFAIDSPVVLVNGGVRGGVTTLFARAFAPALTPPALVARIEIAKAREEGYGSIARVELPRISGGHGSLIGISLKVGRKFVHRGERKSLLSARCPDEKLKVETPRLLFMDELRAPPSLEALLKGTFSFPCRMKG